MLRIGEFARLAGVTVKALRLYADVGLLRPAVVDPWTGYRRYDVAQLAAWRSIQALKELGLGLREIATILDRPESLSERLLQHRGRLSQQIEVASERRSRLDRLIGQCHAEPIPVVVRRSPPFRALAVKGRLGTYEEIERLFSEAARRVPRGASVRGRVAAWHAGESTPGRIVGEALLVVDEGCRGAVEVGGQEVASLLYRGEAWQEPYACLTTWLADHKCMLAGPKLEHLLPDGLVELQFPIRPAASA